MMKALTSSGICMDTTAAQPYLYQLTHQRIQLLAQVAQQRGGKLGRAEVAHTHFDNSQDDQAQIRSERELEFALNEHELVELQAIEDALKRIQEGVYGLCLSCGVPIPHERLHAEPQALRCVACQTTFETATAH
jgi:DnaK suppressor protein